MCCEDTHSIKLIVFIESMTPTLEICIDSVASAVAAERGGASRVELCDNLYEGGTTPSIGLLTLVLQNTKLPVHVMVRPRGGDFLYSPVELEVMRADIRALKAAGAHGIVLGVLDSLGRVDEPVLRELVGAAAPLPVTFHRAIDLTVNAVEAVHACARCGVSRLLSSGGAPTAMEGCDTLRRMVEAAGGRMIVAAGGGVTEANCAAIAAASGADELHGSLRKTRASGMRSRPAVAIPMGSEKRLTPESEYEIREADAGRVAAVAHRLLGVAQASATATAATSAAAPPRGEQGKHLGARLPAAQTQRALQLVVLFGVGVAVLAFFRARRSR